MACIFFTLCVHHFFFGFTLFFFPFPFLQQDMLSEFFDKIHAGRSVLCAGLMPKRMQMPWRDFKNKSDYGVYLMRHMETFVGQGVS